jgi:hypothetical protein
MFNRTSALDVFTAGLFVALSGWLAVTLISMVL